MSPRRLLPASLTGIGLLLAACSPSAPAPEADAASGQASQGTVAPSADPVRDRALQQRLRGLLDAHRRIVVLLADEATQSPHDRAISTQIGQQLFHQTLQQRQDMATQLDQLLASGSPQRLATLGALLEEIESAPDLYDADRLAFREVLRELQVRIGKESALPAVKLHQRIGEDLDALDQIERNYNQEITRIFGRFDSTRAIAQRREKWEDYVAHLRRLHPREAILRDHGLIEPYPMSMQDSEREIFGRDLPDRTVALTFDDGPHGAYTEEIVQILKRYDVPATFFEVGRNVGKLDAHGKPLLSPLSKVSRALMEQGYTVGNHSLSHAQLSKASGESLRSQVLDADTLLRAVDERRAPLFRFPYGARNAEGMQVLKDAGLKSIMWNIDSMDWADPVPDSIAQRVLAQVEQQQRGIVLFHDIHDRTVKALPAILDRLVAEGYQFAGWNGREFSVARARASAVQQQATVTTAYASAWAIVIGIDDYARWPRLAYAANDAQAVANTLTDQFGFPSSQVIVLKNDQATRNNILAAFHDRLADGKTQKDDRVFVFFAGHGATRTLASGRELGYIIPVDSDPAEFATDGIAMSDIQNIAESLRAKHVLFVMDACYSGLGLTRGGGSPAAYLRENARRTARQMLTAGGADQQVADSGPNGHSVFTWVLLQALSGKGDLNGDGLITGTELAAYVAPAVSSVSQQTPAFGSLPGSQGGEFVFQMQQAQEFLTADSSQLSSEAIALNRKVEAAQPEEGKATVTVQGLQGTTQTLTLPAAARQSDRELAERANERGLQLYREKRYDDAAAQFAEALKLRPDYALAANNLGFVYYRQGRFQQAARWLENTLKIDPSRAVAWFNLGDAWFQLGEKAQARKAYQTYLELQPQGPSAGQARAQLEKL